MTSRAYQRVDRDGFVLDGIPYEGFADCPELPLVIRRQIARWAVRRGEASAAQRELAAVGPVAGPRSELLEVAQADDRLMASPVFSRAFSLLSDDEQLRVLRPEAFLDKQVAWPLVPSAVESLFPTLTANRIRDWDNQGLVPSDRWGRGHYRGYFRGKLVVALLIARLIDAGWSIERLKRELRNEPESEREAMASVKALVAAGAGRVVSGTPGGLQRDRRELAGTTA